MSNLVGYFRQVLEAGGSDLHICAESPPIMRLHGELIRLDGKSLSHEETRDLILPLLSQDQFNLLAARKNIDFASQLDMGDFSLRTRVNVYFQRRGVDGVFRIIPADVPALAGLGLPQTVASMVGHHQGLILVTGPVGCGKTTTLAALVGEINRQQMRHIVTIEDPVEYLHVPARSLINQRQVGNHVESFSRALRAAVREDADVILVGELRDLETTRLALGASESGHLVLGTGHTASAAKTVERLVDIFSSREQPRIRSLVSDNLRGVVSQMLLPRAAGGNRVLACEILVGSLPIADAIRKGKTLQIPSVIESGRHLGMRLMDDSILELAQSGSITMETAVAHAVDVKAMKSSLGLKED